MYQVELEQFNGPLELLLKLIQDKELNISQISLAKIADQYLTYLEAHESEIDPDELADFLWIGSKLIYLKSRLLVPTMSDEEDEELDDLEKQLKIYKEYLDASKQIIKIIKQQRFSYSQAHQESVVGFYPPQNFKISDLGVAFSRVLSGIIPMNKLPQKTIQRIISLKERISEVRDYILRQTKTRFSSLLSDKKDPSEIIVTFLAVLELSKQNSIHLVQEELFAEIEIAKIK
ncbi:MAG: ScpA family protein [Patescibacteria group bacterium]